MRIILILLLAFANVFCLTIAAYSFNFRADSDNPYPGNDRIKLGIYDATGRYSGYNPVNPRNLSKDAPGFWGGAYGGETEFGTMEPIISYVEGETPNGTGGLYKLAVYGLKQTPYGINGYMVERGTGASSKFFLQGIIDVGQVKYFEISYIPGHLPNIFRVASSNDFLADITTASKLGYLGNAEFASELIKKVQKIEKERLAPQKPEEQKTEEERHLTPAKKAIKEYRELLKEITEKYQRPEGDEFVKQEAYTVLKEDLDYIIGHLQ